MTDKSILVTGGSGYFGQACVRTLLDRGAERVCVFSRGEFTQYQMRQAFNDDPRLRFFVGDVRDAERLERAMQGVDLVIHAAALKRVEVGEYDASEMVKTNILGAMNVISAARKAHVAKVVSLSTDKACEPTNCYGATKLAAEKLMLAENNASGGGTKFSVVRYGNVAGSTGSVIPIWRQCMEKGRMAYLTHPEATRFWMTREQAVDLVLRTAETMPGDVQIPDLPAYRLADLAEAMDVPYYEVIGLQPGEKMHESMRTGQSSDLARRMAISELREELACV